MAFLDAVVLIAKVTLCALALFIVFAAATNINSDTTCMSVFIRICCSGSFVKWMPAHKYYSFIFCHLLLRTYVNGDKEFYLEDFYKTYINWGRWILLNRWEFLNIQIFGHFNKIFRKCVKLSGYSRVVRCLLRGGGAPRRGPGAR